MLENLFKNIDLFNQAMTHKSFAFENGKQNSHNEKLEFLGDAVLDLILSHYLMKEFVLDDEGKLSKKRASLVNEAVLAQVAENLGLGKYIKLGKGEQQTGGVAKPRLLASCYEAFVGALFLDSGFDFTFEVVVKHFYEIIKNMNPDDDYSLDYKTKLQEILQAKDRTSPQYELISSSGPAHNKIFQVAVKVNENVLCTGEGKSKKQAEQLAAQKAIDLLRNVQS